MGRVGLENGKGRAMGGFTPTKRGDEKSFSHAEGGGGQTVLG